MAAHLQSSQMSDYSAVILEVVLVLVSSLAQAVRRRCLSELVAVSLRPRSRLRNASHAPTSRRQTPSQDQARAAHLRVEVEVLVVTQLQEDEA